MKLNVLFVDDEPNILRGLRRMLRSMRNEWNMNFAGGGEEALEELRGGVYHAIVTDMRMPGMNGAELLEKVKEKYPNVVRFILSGQSDDDVTIYSIGCAHQFFSKPCNAEVLKGSLLRSCEYLEILNNDEIRTAILSLVTLPVQIETYRRLMEWVDSDHINIKTITQLLINDLGIACKLLQLTNSAFFGIYSHVSSVKQAIDTIGPVTLKKIFDIYRDDLAQYEGDRRGRLDIEEITKHSNAISLLAGEIMRFLSAGDESCDDSAIAGKMHDIGMIFLDQLFPEKYGAILNRLQQGDTDIIDLEREIFATTHAETGAALLGLWGYPKAIVDAVLYHHIPSASGQAGITPLTATHISDMIEPKEKDAWGSYFSTTPDREYIGNLGLEENLAEWERILSCIEEECVLR